MWMWMRLERQLLHQIRTCQIVATTAVNDDANGSFVHNAFGVEQSVALVLLRLCNLCIEDSLHNKTLILVSVSGSHVFFRMS
jgi:hypothetical protein